jgi:hypothetical protein
LTTFSKKFQGRDTAALPKKKSNFCFIPAKSKTKGIPCAAKNKTKRTVGFSGSY